MHVLCLFLYGRDQILTVLLRQFDGCTYTSRIQMADVCSWLLCHCCCTGVRWMSLYVCLLCFVQIVGIRCICVLTSIDEY